MEVFLGKDEDIILTALIVFSEIKVSYRFVKQHSRQEVVENLSDFRMSLDILLVTANQLIL